MKRIVLVTLGACAWAACLAACTERTAQEAQPSGNPALNGYWADEFWWSRRNGGEVEGRPAQRPTPALTPAAAAAMEAALAEASRPDAPIFNEHTATCQPYSLFGIGIGGGPLRDGIVQRPGEVVFIAERWQTLPRHIFTDGRGHPADLKPSPNGHSIGHWEGDTLVVETIGFDGSSGIGLNPRVPLEYGPDLKVTERFDVIEDGNILLHEMTFEDATVFAEPYTLVQRRVRDDEQHTAVESTCIPDTPEGWDDRQVSQITGE